MGYQHWPDDFPSEYKTPLLGKTSRKKKSLRERIPARYVLTLLTFLGLGIQYTQRVNLNVTMVAMVNTSFIEGKENDTTLDECPNPFISLDDNSTTPVLAHKEFCCTSATRAATGTSHPSEPTISKQLMYNIIRKNMDFIKYHDRD